MHPAIIAAIITGGAALGSAALGGGKGKPTEMTSANPEMDKYRQQLMEMAMQKMGQQQPYAQVNPMNMNAANMASQFYTGQPYTHPGYGMGQPGGGMPGQQPMPYGQQGMGGPTGGGGQRFPQVPGAPGGMPGQNMQYGPQLQKGANFAR